MPHYRNPTRSDWVIACLMVGAFTAVILIAAFLLAASHALGFLLLAGALLLLLVSWHAAHAAYRCPECENKFT